MRRHWVGLLLLAVSIGAVIPLVLGGREVLHSLASIPVSWLLGMVAMIFLCWNLNAWRLRLMLKGRADDFGHRSALTTTMATECAINATPGGSGAPFMLAALLGRHGVSPSTATAILAVDQLTDMLVFALLLPTLVLYGLANYLDLGGWWQLVVPLGLLVLALLAVVALARHHRVVLLLAGEALRALRVGSARRFGLARSALRFRYGIRDTLLVPRRRLVGMFVLCLMHWLLRYSVLYLAVLALGQHIDWSYGFFVQMVAMGAGHLTLLPGGAGGAEVAGAALLHPWLGVVTTAAAIVIWRFMTFYLYLIAGGLVMLFMMGRQARWVQGSAD